MKKILGILLLGAILTTTGCISIHNNKSATANVPPAQAITPDRYAVETELGPERVSATVTGNTVLGIIKWGFPQTYADFANIPNGDISSPLPFPIPIPLPFFGSDSTAPFKKAAVYVACEENNCDSLLDCRYVITVKDYVVFKQITCKVIGTPVIIKGYRKIEDEKK